MEFLIITGMSGAGKSQAVKALEDINYYCMDNVPPSLLPEFASLCRESKKSIEKVAIVVDIRGGIFFDDLFKSLDFLESEGFKHEILFLDAKDSILTKRFKELRRPHPLTPDGRVLDGIETERLKLKEVKAKANHLIDTSNLTTAMLKEEIHRIFLEGKEHKKLSVSIISFGFKLGIPIDCDLVFDVRFLPNPHYIDELKNKTGNDEEVQKYVMKFSESNEFFRKLTGMVDFLIPHYIKEGKSQLVIGIGCTGGKHRSVTIANMLGDYIEKDNYRTVVTHRDIMK